MNVRAVAQTVEQAYISVKPDEALPSGDQRYVELDKARGASNLADALARRIEAHELALIDRQSSDCACFLVTGHRGCGKTTELYRLRERLVRAHFAVVYFDAVTEFDLQKQSVDWWNVLLEIVWQIDDQLSQEPYNLQVPESLRDDAVEWLARIVTKKTERTEMEASLITEFEIGAGLSFFAKAKAAIKALVRAGSSTVKEIEREAERRPMVLQDAVCEIIAHANGVLSDRGYRRLVIIVDGLEKSPLRQLGDGLTTHNNLFVHNGNRLQSPPCHMVYTIPLALLAMAPIGQVFPDWPLLLPMVRVRHRGGEEDRQALRSLSQVIERRVAPSLFAPGVIKLLALASGGHIRDLLLLVRDAAGEFGDRITQEHARRAIARLTDFYDRTIQQEFLPPLDFVDQYGTLPGGPHDGELINRLLALEYRNDETWHALHPCVKDSPRYARSPRAGSEDST